VSSTGFSTHHFALDNEILLEKGQMYLLVVKANGTSTGNVWRVGGFTEVCNNNVHQDTYIYNTDGSLTPQTADMLSNQVLDMFIGLGISQVREHNLSYSKQGIYTGSFEIENDAASRVRISFNPDRNGKELIDFNVHDYYKVNVVGKLKGLDEFVAGVPDKIDELNNHKVKVYSHRVLAAGNLSAYEYVYDFDFGGQEVDFIEFQIVYNSIDAVGEDAHGALYAVVASTDNAFLGKEE
jgi:FAD synthase